MVSLGRVRRSASQGQALQTLFNVGSFGDLSTVSFPEGTTLKTGSPFNIEMDIKFFLAKAFDVAGAELVFKPFIPAGLRLVDVHSSGFSTVVVEMVVEDVAGLGQKDSAKMGLAPLLLGIVAFIGAHWVGLSLATIGVAFGLGFLVNAIRGKGVLGNGGGLGDIKDIATIGLLLVGGVLLLGVVNSARGK